MNGFFKFVVRGNVVGLAVGVVIGAAFSTLVGAFVSAFLTPLVGVATDNVGDFSNKYFTVGKETFHYGSFINAIVAFALTAAAIYFLVVLPVNKITEELNPYHDLAKAKRACPECLSSIPAEAKRCSFCATAVDPITDEFSDKLIEETPGAISLGGPVGSIKLEGGVGAQKSEGETAKAE